MVVAVIAYLAVSRWRTGRWMPIKPSSTVVVATAVAIVAVVALGVVAADQTGDDADEATISSVGSASVEEGPYYEGELLPAEGGELHLVAEQRNPRVTPLPPHDRVSLEATFTHPDGTVYEVVADQPLVDDPLGRFGTWWGVGFDEWHHGRSGIGSELLPATLSKVAVLAVGQVRADGEIIAVGVPVHVMTLDHEGMRRLEFDVGDPAAPLPGVPDGHLRVIWDDYEGGHSHRGENAPYALGAGVLITLLVLAIGALPREESAGAP